MMRARLCAVPPPPLSLLPISDLFQPNRACVEGWAGVGQGLHWCKVAKLPDDESAAGGRVGAHVEAESGAPALAVQVLAPRAAVACARRYPLRFAKLIAGKEGGASFPKPGN